MNALTFLRPSSAFLRTSLRLRLVKRLLVLLVSCLPTLRRYRNLSLFRMQPACRSLLLRPLVVATVDAADERALLGPYISRALILVSWKRWLRYRKENNPYIKIHGLL